MGNRLSCQGVIPAGAPEVEGVILLVLDLEEDVEHHGPAAADGDKNVLVIRRKSFVEASNGIKQVS